jgi:hypothetical protein
MKEANTPLRVILTTYSDKTSADFIIELPFGKKYIEAGKAGTSVDGKVPVALIK